VAHDQRRSRRHRSAPSQTPSPRERDVPQTNRCDPGWVLPGRPRPDRPGTAHPAAPDASSSSWRFATRHSSISAHRRPGPSYYRSTPLSAETCAPTPRNQRPVSMPPRPRRANLAEPSGQTALIRFGRSLLRLGQPRFPPPDGGRPQGSERQAPRAAFRTGDGGRRICENDASGTGNLFGVDGSDGGVGRCGPSPSAGWLVEARDR